MKEIILKALRGQIEKIPSGKNIFVLKGVPLNFVGEENFPEDELFYRAERQRAEIFIARGIPFAQRIYLRAV